MIIPYLLGQRTESLYRESKALVIRAIGAYETRIVINEWYDNKSWYEGKSRLTDHLINLLEKHYEITKL